jgi:hypothetical protein
MNEGMKSEDTSGKSWFLLLLLPFSFQDKRQDGEVKEELAPQE